MRLVVEGVTNLDAVVVLRPGGDGGPAGGCGEPGPDGAVVGEVGAVGQRRGQVAVLSPHVPPSETAVDLVGTGDEAAPVASAPHGEAPPRPLTQVPVRLL